MSTPLADALNLDLRTLAVVAVFVVSIAAFVPVVLRQLAPDEDAVKTWSTAAALGVTATVMAVQRREIWSILGLVGADATAAAAFVLVVQGTRQVIGAPASRRPALFAAGAFVLLDVFLVYLWPSPIWRTCAMIAHIGAWSLFAAYALLRSGYKAGQFLGVIFFLLGTVAAYRAGGIALRGTDPPMFAATPERLLDFGSSIVLGTMGTIGALLLVAEVALEALRAQAFRDALTQLPNRAALEDAAGREIARMRRTGRPLGLLIIDLDHFKGINDALGHPVGDAVLVAIGKVMQTALRREDIVGRYGGEEFVALLPSAPESEIAGVAERLRRAVAETTIVGEGHAVRVTVSVGGTALREGETDWLVALERADRNLYAAKRAGRDRVVVGDGEGLPPAPKPLESAPIVVRPISGGLAEESAPG